MSFISTYQSCKTAFAEKLQNIGIADARGSDGLTTLINYLGEVQHFTDGILISADKDIAQSGDTIKFSILVLEDGKYKANASVSWFNDFINQTYAANTTINQDIGDEWAIDVGDADVWICESGSTIAGGNAIMSLSDEAIVIYKNGNIAVVRATSTSEYSYKDGVLYYADSSLDISSYGIDVTNLYKTSDSGGKVKVTYPITLTTNSYGIASYDYTCSGAGIKSFTARYGMFQSEIYDVLDCIYYDGVSSDTTSNYYINSNNTSIVYNDGFITATALTSTSGSLYVDLRTISNSVQGKTINVSVDVELNNVSTRLKILRNGSSFMNTLYTTEDGTLTLSNVELTSADTYYFRIETRNTSINDIIKFKNWKIYPV